jgi:hypothetical protein
VLRLVEKIAAAVHAVHEAGVIHRDLKPGNIRVRPNGEPVVLDFGLAMDEASSDERLTEEGDALGTPHYMAPEQVEGKLSAIGPRTDVYALGVILYELLTLKVPFEGVTRGALFQRILKGESVRPRKLNQAIPKDLEAVCLMALALEPERRYATALELAEDLRRVRTLRPTVAKPPSAMGRLLRRARRNPISAMAVFSCTLSLAAALVVGVRWFQTRSTVSSYEAATRVLLAASRNLEPSAQDLDVLSRLLPDGAARGHFLSNPFSTEGWERIEELLVDLPRGAADDVAEYRLLAPRAAVTEARPTFRFEVPDPGGEEWHFEVVLSEDGLETRTYEVAQGPNQTGPLQLTPPEGEQLEVGREYDWTARLDPVRHREFSEHYSPGTVRFQVLDPAVRARALGPESITGDAAEMPVKRLAAAAALNAQGLARDALEALEGFPETSSREEKALSHVLRAEALALLGDRKGVENEHTAFRGCLPDEK